VLSDLIELVDCLRSICNAEFDIIGFPYLLLIKSSISCDIVVIHNQYFLALFISPKRKFADISLCNIIHASSQTSNLLFL
jgi:hypothetical protein